MADRVLVERSRPRLVAYALLSLAFAAAGVAQLAAGSERWLGALGTVLFGGLLVLFLRELGRRGPALVIDGEGIEDRRAGVRVAWEDVERVEALRRPLRLGGQRFLRLRLRGDAVDVVRFDRGIPQRLARADRALGLRVLDIQLATLSLRAREVLDAVRERYDGAIDADF